MEVKTEVKPILKWAGGKQGLAGYLVRQFPQKMGTYFEPFVGGASVLLTLRPSHAFIADRNEWLMDTYHAIRDDWRRVAEILDTLKNTKREYLKIRAIQPTGLDLFRRAAHLIYLNKTCFRGLFRVNRKNEFNVPYGAYDRRYYDPDNLAAVGLTLEHVQMRSCDFELAIEGITKRDFVYFDPPYYKLGGYSDFNRYTRFQFRENDHIRLAAICRELHGKGIRWAVSNSSTEFIRSLFRGFRMISVANRREINLNSQERGISELLIMNY
jgi:DNA adenine methylase